MSIILNKYMDKGLTGLANLGNTCYINSSMQVLSHCYVFNELIDSIDSKKINNDEESVLLLEWKKLKDLMWDKNCIISPNRFIGYIQEVSKHKKLELFSGFSQNDLPEFIIFIIDCFHNALKRKVEMNITGEVKNNKDILAKECFAMIKKMYSETYSELLNIFYGIHVSQIISKDKTGILSAKPEPFILINLPFPINTNECSIYDCFDIYTENEFLEKDNAWFNEKTNKKEDVYKSIAFWSLPNILIVDFKKFTYDNRKINIKINSPLNNLDLSKYVVGYNKETFIYTLFGVCNHTGGCLGGHYTANVKNANGKWYKFNDTSVTEINEANVINNHGYCYFYVKNNK